MSLTRPVLPPASRGRSRPSSLTPAAPSQVPPLGTAAVRRRPGHNAAGPDLQRFGPAEARVTLEAAAAAGRQLGVATAEQGANRAGPTAVAAVRQLQ